MGPATSSTPGLGADLARHPGGGRGPAPHPWAGRGHPRQEADSPVFCRSRRGRHVMFYPTLKVRGPSRHGPLDDPCPQRGRGGEREPVPGELLHPGDEGPRPGHALGSGGLPTRWGQEADTPVCRSPCRCGWSWPRSWVSGCPSGSWARAWTTSTTYCRPASAERLVRMRNTDSALSSRPMFAAGLGWGGAAEGPGSREHRPLPPSLAASVGRVEEDAVPAPWCRGGRECTRSCSVWVWEIWDMPGSHWPLAGQLCLVSVTPATHFPPRRPCGLSAIAQAPWESRGQGRCLLGQL